MAVWGDLSLRIVCPFFVFMIVHSLGQSLKARAGALEHALVLCEIISKLKTFKRDIKNIVCDMAP